MTPKQWHQHGCTTCRGPYSDTCNTPHIDGRCNPCTSGIPSVWAINRRPNECCYTHTRKALKQELKTYRLAGPGPWYICTRCHRTQIYVPAKKEDDT